MPRSFNGRLGLQQHTTDPGSAQLCNELLWPLPQRRPHVQDGLLNIDATLPDQSPLCRRSRPCLVPGSCQASPGRKLGSC